MPHAPDAAPQDGRSAPAALEAFRPFIARSIPLIVVLVLLGAGGALAYSTSQEREYDAEARLSFTDPSSDVALVGVPIAPTQQAPAIAAAGVNQVTRQRTFAAVAAGYGEDLPDTPKGLPLAVRRQRFTDRLESATTTSVDVQSNLVVVTVRWPNAALASRLANLVTATTAMDVNKSARRAYERRAEELRKRIAGLPPGKAGSIQRQTRTDYQTQISRLVSLSTLASPVQIASYATPPTSPAVPKPVLTSTIGGFLGLLVAIALSVLRGAFDRRVRDTTELAGLMGQPLTGQFPKSVLGTEGPLVNDTSRRADLLVDYARVLRQNLVYMDVDDPIKVVAVTSATEGEGKSTVASSLAVAAAAAGDAVLLIDGDLRRPVLADRFEVASEPGLSDHLVDGSDLELALRRVELPVESASVAHHLSVLPAGRHVPHPADILDSERFRALLAEVRGSYDLVVIDTAPLTPVPDTSTIVTQADAVVLCCRVDEVSRDAFLAGRERLARLDIGRVAIAATGVTKRRGAGPGSYGYDQGTYYGYTKAKRKTSRRRRRFRRRGRRR